MLVKKIVNWGLVDFDRLIYRNLIFRSTWNFNYLCIVDGVCIEKKKLINVVLHLIGP